MPARAREWVATLSLSPLSLLLFCSPVHHVQHAPRRRRAQPHRPRGGDYLGQGKPGRHGREKDVDDGPPCIGARQHAGPAVRQGGRVAGQGGGVGQAGTQATQEAGPGAQGARVEEELDGGEGRGGGRGAWVI